MDLLARAEGALGTAVAATSLLLGDGGIIGLLGLLALGRLLALGHHVFILGFGLRRRGRIDVDLHYRLGGLYVHLLLVRLGLLDGLLLGPARLLGFVAALSSGSGGAAALLVGGLATGGGGGLLGGLGLASGRCGTSHCEVVVGSGGCCWLLLGITKQRVYLNQPASNAREDGIGR